MWRLTCALLVLTTVAGCKNQTTGQVTNPFLTPDKVPPPSTRVLAPGTAQPFYPNDLAPGMAPGQGFPQPMIGQPIPGAGAPPGTAYPGAAPPTFSTPPGGWTTPPQSSLGDGASASLASFNAPASTAPTFNSYATLPADVRVPIQSMLPLGGAPYAGPTPQRLTEREVTPAEFLAGSGSTSPTGVLQASTASSSDGFRPQGSTPRASEPDRPDQSFRPPVITHVGVAGPSDSSAQFAAGTNFESLRGQLEYWPESGAWSLRYLQAGVAADSLGGRVMIENPQVLANLSPGELVSVRGQLFGQQDEDGNTTAAYRVSAVERQRR